MGQFNLRPGESVDHTISAEILSFLQLKSFSALLKLKFLGYEPFRKCFDVNENQYLEGN